METNTTTATELLEEALELLEQVTDLLHTVGLADDPSFRAYHLGQLEGNEGGWLGGPFLVDAVRSAYTRSLGSGDNLSA